MLAAAAPKGASEPRDINFPDLLICLHCDARTAAESAAGAAVAGRLRQNPENGLASLSEICLPHLRLLAGALGDNPTATKLLAREALSLRQIAEDMRRYALKHDVLRRCLESEEETNAAQRALSISAGLRTLNTPAPRQWARIRPSSEGPAAT